MGGEKKSCEVGRLRRGDEVAEGVGAVRSVVMLVFAVKNKQHMRHGTGNERNGVKFE